MAKIKDGMKREKLFQDKKTMPRINQAVAKRFVRHELWTPKDSSEEQEKTLEDSSGTNEPEESHVNKKRRLE